MALIGFTTSGSFRNTERFLRKMSRDDYILEVLRRSGEMGVTALSNATPVDSGLTAESWYYKVSNKRSGYSLSWHNSNSNEGVQIAILLQYGHGTGTGGYVQGRDYINPAIQPVFDRIADEVWKAVRSA